MKQIIKGVLDDMSEGQINLASSAARETVSSLISAALKTKGSYTEYGDDEIEEQEARATWVCSICGENTADVEYDYLGSGTNHLGCEMKNWDEIKDHINENDDSDSDTGPETRVVDDAGVDIKTGKYVGGNLKFDPITEDLYTDEPYEGLPEGLKRAKELSREAIKEELQRRAYLEMTSDGLPEGGDTQAVLESHKLADEIVDNKDEKWIYESPDGGKTVFRRPFSDYDPEKKVEIDWETKEPTGRKFTEYNNGNWRSKDEG